MTTKKFAGDLPVAGIAASLIAMPALAAGPATDPPAASGMVLEEVLVTARRREENLQTVPVAVTALSGEALAQKGVQNIMDIQKFVPSLRVVSADVNPKIFFVSIRGFRGQSPALTEDPPIGTYFAEGVIAHPIGFGDEMFDIESVQVLKGPQGTLFGRNTTGGAVLIEPNKPSLDGFSGNTKLAVGEYNLNRFTGAVNIPVGDSAALRVAGDINKRDGYTTNVLSGQKYDEVNNRAARVSFLLEPTESFSSNTILSYLYEDGAPASTALAAVLPQAVAPALLPRYQQALAQQQALGPRRMVSMVGSNITVPTTPGGGVDGFSPARCTPGATFLCRDEARPNERLKVVGALNNSRLEFGGVAVKNIVSYRKTEHAISGYDITPGGLFTQGLQALQSNDIEQVSDELQVSGRAFNDRLDWISGLFWFREQGTGSSPAYQFRADIWTHNKNKNVNESKAVFAQGDYAFTDQWKLTLGVRESWDKREGRNLNTAQIAGTPPTTVCTLVNLSGARLCNYTVNPSWSATTWNASLQYQVQPDTLLYGSVRKGYKSGGFARIPPVAEKSVFNPEYVLDFEIGVKSEWSLAGMQVRTNAAAFYDKYEDEQVQVSEFIPGVGVRNFTDNAGKAHIYGGELELTVLPTANLEVSGFVSYLRGAYDEYVTQSSLAGNAPVDISDIPFGQNYAIPEWQGGLSIQYRVPMNDLGALRFSADGSFRSRAPTNNAAVFAKYAPLGFTFQPQMEEPGRGIVNARIDWERVLGGPVDVGVFATNLTDKTYIEGGTFLAGVETVHYAAPRMIGVEANYKFGQGAK